MPTSSPSLPKPPLLPQTPPLQDPSTTSFRPTHLTPNLHEIVSNFTHPTSPYLPPPLPLPLPDLLSSPDPTSLYNSLQIGSPILHDFYPHPSLHSLPFQSPVPTYDPERAIRMAAAAAEMNALFSTGCEPMEGDMSLLSSPDLRFAGGDGGRNGRETREGGGSQTSTQTLCLGDGSHTPTSEEVDETTMANMEITVSELENQTPQPDHHVQKVKEKLPKKKAVKPRGKHSRKRQSQKPLKIPVSSPVSNSLPVVPGGLTSVAENGFVQCANGDPSLQVPSMTGLRNIGMNPGFVPFACAMPGIVQMGGSFHYQGRPIGFVAPGRHNAPEFIPVDAIAQAQAQVHAQAQAQVMQYGVVAAQVERNRILGIAGAAGNMTFEGIGGSRKKRRRLLLEKSGCSEEQARQNRKHALDRLRQKKSLRGQQSLVRYACRKRIAMVRPRVNGRFATKEEVEQCQRGAQ